MTKKSRTRMILKLPGIVAEDILSRYEKIPTPTIDLEESFRTTKPAPRTTDFREITSMCMLLESGEPYPEFTNSRCKWDHYPFETQPVGLPIKYQYRDGLHYFTCEGYFCSLNCVQAYIKKMSHHNPLYANIATNFNLLCNLVTGNSEIQDASAWEFLDCYNDGKGINIDELRKGQVTYRKIYNIKLLPCGEYYERTPKMVSHT